jgi:hypothetical protein
VRVAVPAALPQPLGQEPATECLGTDVKALGGQFLGRQCGTEVGVAGAVGLENLPAEGGIMSVIGGLAPQAVDQGGITARPELVLDASDLAGTESEESGRFGLGPLAIEDRLHHLEDIAFALAHLHTGPVLYLDHLAHPSA